MNYQTATLVVIFLSIAYLVWNVQNTGNKMRRTQERLNQNGLTQASKEIRRLYMATAINAIVCLGITHLAFLFTIDRDIRPITIWLFVDKGLAVLDVMAKGAFLDLFESFEITLGGYEAPEEWKFVDSCLQFICRTGYSISYALLAFGTWQNLKDWWRKRNR